MKNLTKIALLSLINSPVYVCHRCNKRLSGEEKKSTLRNPETYYCEKCFQEGLEMEREAMGMNDPGYSL